MWPLLLFTIDTATDMLTRAILRALFALLIGFLLVNNPTDMTVLLVQIIGGLFALSGLVAFIGYFTAKARATGFRPVFPIVGVGSLAFGVVLLLMPTMFVNILMYVLGILLCLIGLGQIVNLISYRFAPIMWSLYLIPLLTIAAGVFVIAYPMATASLPFMILGIAYIFYGVCEFFMGIRYYRYYRSYEAEQAELAAAKAAQEAATAEEVATEVVTETAAAADSDSTTSDDSEIPTAQLPESSTL